MVTMRLLELPSHSGRDYRLMLLFPTEWSAKDAKAKASTVIQAFHERDTLFLRTNEDRGEEFDYRAFLNTLQEAGFALIEDQIEGPFWDKSENQ